MSAKKKQVPRFATDEEAERFVDTADLAEYDLNTNRERTPQPRIRGVHS